MSTRPAAPDKDLAKVERIARAQGWEVKLTRSGHLRWRSPEGVMVTTSATPSDHYALLKAKNDLKKAGLELTTRRKSTVKERVPRKAKTRTRIPGLSDPEVVLRSLHSIADWNPDRETVFSRARLVLDMAGKSDEEVALAIKTLTSHQQEIVFDILAADEMPSKVCGCGKAFTSLLYAGIHARKCGGKRDLAIEPENELVSHQPDTIPAMQDQSPTEQENPVETTTESSTVCPTCDKAFGTPQARAAHQRSHTILPCQYCQRAVPSNAHGQHEIHCENNPNKNRLARKRKVSCEHCGKSMQLNSLATHIKAFCAVAEHKRKMGAVGAVDPSVEVAPIEMSPLPTEPPADVDLNGSVPLAPKPTVYDDEYFDTLLNIVIDGRPVPFSLSTVKVVNQWIECTRTLLETLDNPR